MLGRLVVTDDPPTRTPTLEDGEDGDGTPTPTSGDDDGGYY